MRLFFASLDESIRRKVSKRKNLPTTMMKLLDVVIRLGDAKEVGSPSGKIYWKDFWEQQTQVREAKVKNKGGSRKRIKWQADHPEEFRQAAEASEC